MPLPKALLKTAILGTEHPEADLSILGANGKCLERALLRKIAALTVQTRVGWLPKVDESPLPETSSPDGCRGCNKPLVKSLATIIECPYQRLIDQWIRVASERNICSPYEYLPKLLNYATRSKDLTKLMLEWIDNRGRWLCKHAENNRWAWVYPHDNLHLWTEKNHRFRHMPIIGLRFVDPHLARELVLEAWKRDGERLHPTILKWFYFGLSIDDEPFLEEYCRTVKRGAPTHALNLLALLPESTFSREMTRLGAEMLQLGKNGSGTAFIVNKSAEIDEVLIRYGLYRKRMNRRTLVRRVLNYVPSNFWFNHWQLSVDELVAVFDNSKWASKFLWQGLGAAIQRENNTDLATQIFLASNFRLQYPHHSALCRAVPAGYLEPAIMAMFQTDNPYRQLMNNPKNLLNAIPYWSDALSKDFVQFWQNEAARLQKIPLPLLHAFNEYAYRISVEVGDEYLSLLDWFPPKYRNIKKRCDSIIDIIKLRTEMHNAISTP